MARKAFSLTSRNVLTGIALFAGGYALAHVLSFPTVIHGVGIAGMFVIGVVLAFCHFVAECFRQYPFTATAVILGLITLAIGLGNWVKDGKGNLFAALTEDLLQVGWIGVAGLLFWGVCTEVLSGYISLYHTVGMLIAAAVVYAMVGKLKARRQKKAKTV